MVDKPKKTAADVNTEDEGDWTDEEMERATPPEACKEREAWLANLMKKAGPKPGDPKP